MNSDLTEVFEVVDRLTNRRVMERIYLTASVALDWLEQQPLKHHRGYRVQSVAVYPPPETATCSRESCDRPVDPAIDHDLCPGHRHQADNLPSAGRL